MGVSEQGLGACVYAESKAVLVSAHRHASALTAMRTRGHLLSQVHLKTHTWVRKDNTHTHTRTYTCTPSVNQDEEHPLVSPALRRPEHLGLQVIELQIEIHLS